MGYKEHLKAGNIVVTEYNCDGCNKLTGIILGNGNIVWLEEPLWCDTDELKEYEIVGIYKPINYGITMDDLLMELKLKNTSNFKCVYSKGLTINDMKYNVEYKATKFDKYTYRITKLKIYGNDFIACRPIGSDYTECHEAKTFEFHKIEEI